MHRRVLCSDCFYESVNISSFSRDRNWMLLAMLMQEPHILPYPSIRRLGKQYTASSIGDEMKCSTCVCMYTSLFRFPFLSNLYLKQLPLLLHELRGPLASDCLCIILRAPPRNHSKLEKPEAEEVVP